MAHARCQIEADEFVSRVGLSFHYTVIVLDGVARLDQRVAPTAIENELAAMSGVNRPRTESATLLR
jgi:hypothetical protein